MKKFKWMVGIVMDGSGCGGGIGMGMGAMGAMCDWREAEGAQ